MRLELAKLHPKEALGRYFNMSGTPTDFTVKDKMIINQDKCANIADSTSRANAKHGNLLSAKELEDLAMCRRLEHSKKIRKAGGYYRV